MKVDEEKAGLGGFYPAFRAGLLLILGGAIVLGVLAHRRAQTSGFAEDLVFSGYVVAIAPAANDLSNVRIESSTEEAELAFPASEAGYLQVGDVVVKDRGEARPRLYREGMQVVPSDFWVSAPMEMPERFSISLEEARTMWGSD